MQHKAKLRSRLSEFMSLQEVTQEVDQFDERATQLMQSYLDDNYSISYHLSNDVLKALV